MLNIINNCTYIKWVDPYNKTECCYKNIKSNRECLESPRAGNKYANNAMAAVAREIRLSLNTARYSKKAKDESVLSTILKHESRCKGTSANKITKKNPDKCATKKVVRFSSKYILSYDVKRETAALTQNQIQKIDLDELDGADQVQQQEHIDKN